MRNIKKKIASLVELVYENSQKNRKERGFPVASVFWVKKEGILGVEINKKSKNGIGNHEGHSESLLINEATLSTNKIIRAIIVLPPCEICLKKMIDTKQKWRIFYLTDALRDKLLKEYLNVENVSIERINNMKHYDLETKIYINYLIYKVSNVSLKHAHLSEDRKKAMENERDKQLEEAKMIVPRLTGKESNDLCKEVVNYFAKKINNLFPVGKIKQ